MNKTHFAFSGKQRIFLPLKAKKSSFYKLATITTTTTTTTRASFIQALISQSHVVWLDNSGEEVNRFEI
ncbi:hypothetical protein DERP_000747 [Dermatophagoides pteronyssinus]|uniref:Uncharacterized protein n=1 Tax=Dermatophagoides pteronyssinus TaxID=6956 RepID=A0ABQ8J122_DERPT|nr:hypothetical protein DERP_000747 [Dermatophagoides pteronyssinus]